MTDDGTILVGSNEKKLRTAQINALLKGEIPVTGTGHAEETVLNAANNMNKTLTKVGSSRPVCLDCETALKSANVQIKSPLSGKKSKTRKSE